MFQLYAEALPEQYPMLWSNIVHYVISDSELGDDNLEVVKEGNTASITYETKDYDKDTKVAAVVTDENGPLLYWNSLSRHCRQKISPDRRSVSQKMQNLYPHRQTDILPNTGLHKLYYNFLQSHPLTAFLYSRYKRQFPSC